MKLAYTATFEWDGYAPRHIAALTQKSFKEKLFTAAAKWINDSRANAKNVLSAESDAEMLEMTLESCDDFLDILLNKGVYDCISEMEADCFVTVTMGIMSVPDACTEIFYITDSECFTHFKNYAGLTAKDQSNPISLSQAYQRGENPIVPKY